MSLKYTSIDKACDLNSQALSYLVDLDQAYFPTPWALGAWDKLLITPHKNYLLIAEDKDAILGFALFDTSSADSFAHLLKIVVNPGARGMGIGKNLLIESLRVLSERGRKSFFLEVEEFNNVAISLYESQGFKTIHKKKHFYTSGATALIMTLDV